MDKKIMKETDYFKGSFLWHFDGNVRDTPPLAALLSARALAKNGDGDTEFANTSAAYEDLPADKKAAYDKVCVIHSLVSSYRVAHLAPDEDTLTYWREANSNPRAFPLVWRHLSGRTSLVVGSTASQVTDGSLDDAELFRILDWVTQPKYVYRHRWEVGDLIIYDNTGVVHRALPYDADSGRVLQRTKLVGEEACV
jgi:alpha-ketoglutarate-dependent taurine dioxygenase